MVKSSVARKTAMPPFNTIVRTRHLFVGPMEHIPYFYPKSWLSSRGIAQYVTLYEIARYKCPQRNQLEHLFHCLNVCVFRQLAFQNFRLQGLEEQMQHG